MNFEIEYKQTNTTLMVYKYPSQINYWSVKINICSDPPILFFSVSAFNLESITIQ